MTEATSEPPDGGLVQLTRIWRGFRSDRHRLERANPEKQEGR